MSENYSTLKSTEDRLTDIICNISMSEWEYNETFAHFSNSNYEFEAICNDKHIYLLFGTFGDACFLRIGDLCFTNERLTNYRNLIRRYRNKQIADKKEAKMKEALSELTK